MFSSVTRLFGKKAGSWFSYGTDKLGQGRETVKKALREDSALYSKIQAQVKVLMSGPVEVVNGQV